MIGISTDFVISANIVGALFLLVIVWGMLLNREIMGKPARYFLICVLLTAFGSVMDALSYLLEGTGISDSLLAIINLFAIGACDLMMIPFMYYTWALVNEKQSISIWYAHGASIVCLLDFSAFTVGTFTGALFTIEHNAFVPGPMYDYIGIAQIVVLLCFFLFVLFRRRAIGTKAVLAIGTYFILPTIAALHEWITGSLSLVYPTTALVMMIVYILLQSGEIEKGRMREKIMYEVSNTDVLTRLNNRRAFDAILEKIPADESDGVLFCDLNGLKKVNDTQGHIAGDAYINSFAALLRTAFADEELFRISGDEFVVLLRNTKEDEVLSRCELFRKSAAAADSIASVGCCCGMGADIIGIIRRAEADMYSEKDRYYATRGITRSSHRQQ